MKKNLKSLKGKMTIQTYEFLMKNFERFYLFIIEKFINS